MLPAMTTVALETPEVGSWRCIERERSVLGIEQWKAVRDPPSSGPVEGTVYLLAQPEKPAARTMLERWYEDLRDLADPRLPRVLAWKRQRGALVVEAVRGVPVARLLDEAREGRLAVDFDSALDIVLEVARGLRHAHARTVRGRPLVHGRVGPDTVWLTPAGDVRLTDLGAPMSFVEARVLPPEMAARSRVGVRSDQWQVAALLYELVTLRPIYPGTWADAFRRAMRGDVQEQLARVRSFHPELAAVLERALAPRARDRFPDDHAFIHALGSLAAGRPSRRRELAAALCGDVVSMPSLQPAREPADAAEPLAMPAWSDGEDVLEVLAEEVEETEAPPRVASVALETGAPRIGVDAHGHMTVHFIPPEDPADTGDRVEISVPGQEGSSVAARARAVALGRAPVAGRGRARWWAALLLAGAAWLAWMAW